MNRARRRAVILLLVVLFSAPLLTALALRVIGWSPGTTDNHGILLEQPAALPVGEESPFAGHWLLVFVPARPCAANCRSVLEALRRVHRGLGRDAPRVILARDGPVGSAAGNRVVDVASAPWRDDLVRAAPGGLRPGAVYLVDPRGFLALWYPPGFEAAGLLEDLEKLLRYSRVGVQ